MVTNFKKSFLLLITAIFFTQSLILGCSTEVDSEIKKMEEEKPDVITVVKKTHSVQGIPESWETTDVYAYVYDNNGNKILIPVTVKDGVATFEADETYTKCVLVSLPKGTNVSAFTDNPASILNEDYQKSEVIDLTKDSLSFVLVKSDYIGIWNSLTDELVINEDGTFSLDIGTDGSADCAGIYVDTKTGVKASYSEKVDGTDVLKNIEFTKEEADVLLGSVNEKETYFVKSTNETPNLNGTWKNSDETTTTIINNESKKIYVKVGETEIWGTIDQDDNIFILQDEESNVIGTGFVSAAGKAYIYIEATGTYEIFTRNGSATESDSKIPSKMFTVTYKSEFAEDVVQEKAEGTVLELQTPSHKGYRFDGWYTNAEKTAKAEATYTIAENLTFYAKWVQQGTVKFTSAQSEHADVTVDLGTEIDIPTPTKEKFDFDGWFIGETKVSGKYVVTKDVELVAKWTALYNVTFETAGGSPVDSLENVRAGTKITLDEAKWDGYEFEWWAAEGKTFVNGAEYTVNSDVIFVAKWAGLCTVVYNTDGGSSVESKTVHAMETIQMPAAPTKDGYRFLGWYTTDENNLMQPYDVFNVTDSVTINAKWVARYKYHFDNNDGNAYDVAYTIVDENTEITIELEPTRDGYVFKGWSDGETTYAVGAKYTIKKDTVFTAEWKQLFTYEYNDGIPADEDPNYQAPTAEDGEVLTLKSAPVREGYVFKGWKVGEQLYDADATYTITADVVFEAVWNELYYYYYDINDGVPTDLDISSLPKEENGTVITVGPAIERTGYIFAGWRVDKNIYQKGDSYTITKDTVFTAIWKVLVTYSSEFTEHEEELVEEGATIVLPPLTHDGYTFNHWTSNISKELYYAGDEVEISEKVTFTAVWTKDPVVYTISGVPTTGWGVVEVYVYNEAEGRENGEFLGTNNHAVDGEGKITFETAKDITHCILVSFGDPDPNSEMPYYGDLEQLLNVSSTYSEDLDVTSGKATFVQYVPKVTYTIKNAEGYNTPYVTIDGEEVASVYDSETKTVTFEYAEGLDSCTIAKNSSGSGKEIIFDENGIGMLNPQYSFVIDPNQVYFRNSKNWHGGIQVYACHSSDPKNVVRIDMTKAADTDQWYYADVDYSLYDTVYFAGQTTNNTNDNGETVPITLDKSKIFYRPSDNRDSSLGKDSGGRDKFNVMNFEKINDWAPGFN